VRSLDNKVFDTTDARCNHEVLILLFHSTPLDFSSALLLTSMKNPKRTNDFLT